MFGFSFIGIKAIEGDVSHANRGGYVQKVRHDMLRFIFIPCFICSELGK